MPKNDETSRMVSPENLWAKPLPQRTGKPITKGTRMRTDEDTDEDEEIDVDAELAEADEYEEEIDDDEVAEDEGDDADETEDDVVEDVDAEADEDDGDVDEDGDLTYESEDGDVESDEENETVVSAVDDDEVDEEDDETEETEVAVETKESRISSMADKKKISLSDHVRNEIEKRKTAGASLRGVDIKTALEKRGITVSAAQVSQLLKKAGVAPGKKGRPAATPAASAPEKPRQALRAGKKMDQPAPKPRAAISRKPATEETPRIGAKIAPKAAPKVGNGFNVPMAQLQAAEEFVSACGGSFTDAERILTAAAQLSKVFGG